MTSTRNKNQLSDYNVKKRESIMIQNYMSNYDYAVNNETSFMDLGSIPKFTGSQLSNNYIDIESMLRGIHSTNLEGESFKVNPELVYLENKGWFEKSQVVMPEDFTHSFMERPKYLN